MKRFTPLALLLSVVLVTLAGCYVVPAPAPRAGVPPPVPPHVLATPHCGWAYGPGWYGWGWYGNC